MGNEATKSVGTQNICTKQRHNTMEICVKSFDGEKYTIDVGVDDTTEDIRRKAASAAELREDGFDISFGGKVMAEGDDTTQLSAGDTIVLTKTKSEKDDAIAALCASALGETRLTAEWFERLADPNLVHLYLLAEVVTEIPSNCLKRGTFEKLDLSGVSVVTTVRDHFVFDCTSLHTADLSGWGNVTHIGRGFFYGCTSLTALDISGWRSVTQIGDSLLSHCSALRTVDLSGWSNLTQIGNSLLQGCSALTTLDFSGWSNTTVIGDYFLRSCTELRTVDFSGWSNVTHAGPFFLYNCCALTTLDLSGWNKVTYIDKNFVSECTSLTNLNLSGWNNVTRIEDDFVSNSSLTTLNWSGWMSVTHIGHGALKACDIRKCSINVTGSSSVVSGFVHAKKRQCVCM